MAAPDASTPSEGERSELVPFATASSPLEAELIANLLRDAGIPAYVEGSLLADEFAVSQRLLGLNSVRVHVPRARLDDAREVLAEAAAARGDVEAAAEATITEEPPPPAVPGPAPSRPSWATVVLPGIAAVAFFVLWMEARTEVRALSASGLTWLDDDAPPGEVVHRWRANDALATRRIDRDGNGVPETVWFHALDGTLTAAWFDDDQNGIPERRVRYGPGGRAVATAFDADQNDVPERREEARGDVTVCFLDADQDGRTERIEERRRDGTLVRAWEWTPDAGFRAVQ